MLDAALKVNLNTVGISRIALGVEYNGAAYHGFQYQEGLLPTIQNQLEAALSCVAGGAALHVTCAGRTDAKVHASGQVVHFDTCVERLPHAWVMGANQYLPKDISVAWAQVVPESFHARFSALARRYQYVIYNDPIRPAHLRSEVAWHYRPLDAQCMQNAAQILIGTHDFSAFRAQECQAKSPIKVVHHLRIIRHGPFVILDIQANAFLHHMVRNIAGTLMLIGAGIKPIDWMHDVLQSKSRQQAGATAAAQGLYLVQVFYPQEFQLPKRYIGPHFLAAVFADVPEHLC